MSPVRAAESIRRLPFQFRIDRGKIPLRNDDVGIQDDQPLSFGPFRPVVPGLARTGIRLGEIPHGQPAFIAAGDLLAGDGRSVLDQEDFEILPGLPGQAVQKLFNFIRTIENGNDDGITHGGGFSANIVIILLKNDYL